MWGSSKPGDFWGVLRAIFYTGNEQDNSGSAQPIQLLGDNEKLIKDMVADSSLGCGAQEMVEPKTLSEVRIATHAILL